MSDFKLVHPGAINTDECALHVLYLDAAGNTQKMVVAMSQSQSEVINKAEEIRDHFIDMLISFGCVPMSIQLELIELIESIEETRPALEQVQGTAQVTPFPSKLNGYTGAGVACDWFVEVPHLTGITTCITRLLSQIGTAVP